jgi:hypothetical protein
MSKFVIAVRGSPCRLMIEKKSNNCGKGWMNETESDLLAYCGPAGPHSKSPSQVGSCGALTRILQDVRWLKEYATGIHLQARTE